MKEKRQITTFYLETLLMMVVFVSIIMVLTRVFGGARARSLQAEHLTNAVTLAQNTAEAVSASGTPGDLCAILNEDRNAVLLEEDGGGRARVRAYYDGRMKPVPVKEDDFNENGGQTQYTLSGDTGDGLVVEAVWEKPEAEDSALAQVSISVYGAAAGEELYSLRTAVLSNDPRSIH